MVDDKVLQMIFHGLKSREPMELTTSCYAVIDHSQEFNASQVREVADALVSLFYLDPADRPEMNVVIDSAVDALVALGPGAVDVLIEDLTDTDLKANLLVGRTLAQMGKVASAALIDKFRKSRDPSERTIALFAMSKMDDPALIKVFPDIVAALDDPFAELRDTAARSVGKLVETFGCNGLSEENIALAFDKLMLKLTDPHPGTRSKAVRSVGKMAKLRCLSESEMTRARTGMESILGIDGQRDWDRAFNVRREAEEAYFNLTGKTMESMGHCEPG
jgi:HEAT repeat protein